MFFRFTVPRHLVSRSEAHSPPLPPPGKVFGADDFLPCLTWVLLRSDVVTLQVDTDYMMELLDPTQLQGEGEATSELLIDPSGYSANISTTYSKHFTGENVIIIQLLIGTAYKIFTRNRKNRKKEADWV